MAGTRDPRGSLWHRWDPHIHAPGTILNDQYRGSDPWDDFLRRIESSAPPIRALGITDYYSLDVYEQVLQWKAKGRLADVSLIFPNIEMRYGIGSGRGSPINLHLLVSPEDPDHVENTRRFLRSLTFQAHDESFRCTRDDLIRLGRAHNKATRDAEAALGEGANQFKVNPDQLREEWKKSGWIRENALIAVPASSNDGSAGLQGDASLAALRKEIERAAHVIFSSQEAVRKFWLGQGAATFEQLNTDWNGCKPCLHGMTPMTPPRSARLTCNACAGSKAILLSRHFDMPASNPKPARLSAKPRLAVRCRRKPLARCPSPMRRG
jgi:hypothetical protein